MHLKCKLSRWLLRTYNINPVVVESKMPNATIAAGMVISIESVLLHHDLRKAVEDKVVVNGIQEDVEVVEEDHS